MRFPKHGSDEKLRDKRHLRISISVLVLVGVLLSAPAMAQHDRAYTVWLVSFNAPELCSDGVCGEDDLFSAEARTCVAYLTGGLVRGSRGKAAFGGAYGAGSTVGKLFCAADADGSNLPVIEDTKTGEYHIVTRTHSDFTNKGGLFFEQITTFGGGCGADAVPGDSDYCVDNQAAEFPAFGGLGRRITKMYLFSTGATVAKSRAILLRTADGITVGLRTELPPIIP